VDPHEVMELLCKDKQLNISHRYLKPGFAFGGSCLPKDFRALVYMAKQSDVDIPMLSGIIPSNIIHIEHAVQTILDANKKNVGMVGLSFKSGTDDLRESPLVEIAERLIGKGYNLKIYDPEVNMSRLMGANRRYIEESIPHIASLMSDSLEDVVVDSEVIVIGLQDSEIIEGLESLTNEDQFILDLVTVPNRMNIKGEYHGVCW
jgi:GDP-mannose 6-dehydrogenase